MPPTKTRVACYSRVSTREQVEGLSLDVQKDAMDQYIKNKRSSGWELYKHYCDAGVSGTTLERPQFNRLMADAKSGRFDIVLVHKLDRVSRTLYNLMTLIYKELEPLGIGFKSVTEAMIDTSTPAGKLMFQQLGAFAEFEVNRTLERTQDGKRRTAELGQFNGGQCPYGFDVVEKKLVPVNEEADVVRWIYQQYAPGKRGTRSISNDLNRNGIPTKLGGKWTPGTVAYILKNPVYKGTAAYYKRKGWKKGHPAEDNPQEKWLVKNGAYEAVVDQNLWDRVQLALERRRTNGNPNRIFRKEYLLSGILYCGHCGAPMWGRTNHSRSYKSHTYVCKNHWTDKDSCPQMPVKCEEIDQQVIQYVKLLTSNPKFIKQIEQDAIASSLSSDVEAANEIKRLEGKIKEINSQLDRARDLCLKGVVTGEEYKVDSIRLKDQRETSLGKLEEMKRQAISGQWEFLKNQEIQKALGDFDGSWANLDQEDKKEFIGSIMKTALCKGKSVETLILHETFTKWLIDAELPA